MPIPEHLLNDRKREAAAELAADITQRIEAATSPEERRAIMEAARTEVLALAVAAESWRDAELPSDHPLFAMTRTWPEAWRRSTFGDDAVDADLAERAAEDAKRTSRGAGERIAELERENAHLRQLVANAQPRESRYSRERDHRSRHDGK